MYYILRENAYYYYTYILSDLTLHAADIVEKANNNNAVAQEKCYGFSKLRFVTFLM